MNAIISDFVYVVFIRFIEAGLFTRLMPGLYSFLGRTGRGENPPPQLGQTLCNRFSTHSVQNVHSKLQIFASVGDGGKSLSQPSQFGLSSNIEYFLYVPF
jgi:hypothetical protein